MNKVEIAERATLGALLLEPSQISDVHDWLAEPDFLHPRSRITYRLLTALASRPGTLDPSDLLHAALADPGARRNQVAGPFIHELMASPGGPGRGAVYGRMVLQASVLRTLTGDAVKLARRSTVTQREPDSFPGLAEAISGTLRHAHALQARLIAADPAYLEQPGTVVETCEPGPSRWSARRLLESELASALVDNPHLIGWMRGWLRVQDFAYAEPAGTYESMVALAASDLPIDHVTTQWNRRDGFAPLDPPPAHLVATRQRQTSNEAVGLACTLLATAVATRTRATADAIVALSHNPCPSTRQRLHTAIAQLDLRCRDATRWLGARSR